MKAGDALDRAAEIDPYESGHQKRLTMLKGKIEENRYQVIASRFTGAAPAAPSRNEEKSLGAGTLQDLMLQAEILVQYGMRNKALERLQRIQQLFPHEEDRNPELHQLYLAAGLTPQYAGGAPAVAAPVAMAEPAPAAPAASADMSAFARVPEITRKLNQQSSAHAILNTAALELGLNWNVDRCVVALRKPGLAVSTMKEYLSDGLKAGQSDVLEDVICRLHDAAAAHGPVMASEVANAAELHELRPQLAQLGARSVLAISLRDGSDSLGLMAFFSAGPRSWPQNDILVFKMIAEQAAVALSNAGLRRLVKNLSVTDENSGLLKRASYLDLLMGEIRRARQQTTPVSVLVMRFGDRVIKDQGDGPEKMMQRLGQVVTANIRQNDLAFRYTANSIAIILGETAEKEGLLAVEKMRRVIGAAITEQQVATSFNAGVAEAVLQHEYDDVDIVTELVNRAERAAEKAIEKSLTEGAGTSMALAANIAAAAVA
jgi:GGDEF domain-containing protein